MGDAPSNSSPPSVYPSQEAVSSTSHGHSAGQSQSTYSQGHSPVGNSPFQPQYHQQFDPSQNAFSAQFDMTQTQGTARQSPYNMAAMANALSQSGYRPNYNPGGQPRYGSAAPNNGMVQQMAPMGPYGGQPNMNPLVGQQYYMAQQPHMQTYYNNQMPTSQQQGNLSPRPNMGYYPNQVMMNHGQQHLAGYYYPQANHFPGQSAAMPGQIFPDQYLSSEYRGPSPGQTSEHRGGVSAQGPPEDGADNRANVVRGPPRKPRQSGHAVWIGNLPPQTELMSLVHHVCKEAGGLESLFLISKSNCAFANFKDEPSCVQAQQKLHDSKFQSVRLVSRLRKSTVEGVAGQTAPTGPAATSPTAHLAPIEPISISSPTEPPSSISEISEPFAENAQENTNAKTSELTAQSDKFFILKSLTVEDLDLSVRNGVWATQSHNEENLNAAFKAADNVYLVFSANKSGEYFGYAKMTSAINSDPAAAIEFAPKVPATNDLDLPKAIPTPATESCPRGNIIDDSARGTIFWEIERDEGDETASEDSATTTPGGHEGEPGSKAWGKPFKLEWLSSTRLPFYRTRGLRNPWNSNREVKIARDGTELEPSVGRKLIGLFNRVQSPAPGSMGMRQGMTVVAGYPPPMPMPMRTGFPSRA